MKPEQLHYAPKTTLRYADPPTRQTVTYQLEDIAMYYLELLQIRETAKAAHAALVTQGVFQSIPTLTSETKPQRPGTYWRAVFTTNSPEVLSGFPRKHYIGSDHLKLHQWKAYIDRTRRAMNLDQLIHDIGITLKGTAQLTYQEAQHLRATSTGHTLDLEALLP